MAAKTAKMSKDMLIADAAKVPGAAEVFAKHGLHCIGCFVSPFETIEQGASAHGIDVEKLVKELNSLKKKQISVVARER